jgi:hypothetical protein
MKNLKVLLIVFFAAQCLFSTNGFSQTKDSLLSDSKLFSILQNRETSRFTLLNKKTNEKLENLNFVKQIAYYYQVLDQNNNLFYIGDDWVKEPKVKDFFGVCGTVQVYELVAKSKKANFEIYEDETFYDVGNKILPALQFKVLKKYTDRILFINGKSEFVFDANFAGGCGNVDPRTVILTKNGKYFTYKNPKFKYDKIDFSNFYVCLKTKRKNLYGMLGVIEPKYKSIEKFEYYLAKSVTAKNETIYIDLEGNEYIPSGN